MADKRKTRAVADPSVYLVGTEKGGVGKTTGCFNLALLRAMAGHKVALVDTDPQENMATWNTARNEQRLEPRLLCVQRYGKIGLDLLELAKEYEVFVDAGGRDSTELRQAIAVARTWVLPTTPGQLDLYTMTKMQTMLAEVEERVGRAPRVLVVLNDVSATTTEEDEAREFMADYERLPLAKAVLHTKVAWRRAVTGGCGLVELKGKNADRDAVGELLALYAEVFGEPYAAVTGHAERAAAA